MAFFKEACMPGICELDAKRRKQLKQAAHHLKPVVRIGQKGVTESLVAEADICLERHGLIKIHVAAGDRQVCTTVAEKLANTVHAEIVHQIGKVFVLYRHGEDVQGT